MKRNRWLGNDEKSRHKRFKKALRSARNKIKALELKYSNNLLKNTHQREFNKYLKERENNESS